MCCKVQPITSMEPVQQLLLPRLRKATFVNHIKTTFWEIRDNGQVCCYELLCSWIACKNVL